MPTQIYYFHGEMYFPQNLRIVDTKFPPGAYNINVAMTDESLAELKASGLRLKPRTEKQTGKTLYKFSRKVEQMIAGETRRFGPPDIKLKQGDTYVDFEGMIGNGSKGTAKVEIYDSKMFGKGHRLLAVAIDELVEYRKADSSDSDVSPAASGVPTGRPF